MAAAATHLTEGESAAIRQDEGLNVDLVVAAPTVVAPFRNSTDILGPVTCLVDSIIVFVLVK